MRELGREELARRLANRGKEKQGPKKRAKSNGPRTKRGDDPSTRRDIRFTARQVAALNAYAEYMGCSFAEAVRQQLSPVAIHTKLSKLRRKSQCQAA